MRFPSAHSGVKKLFISELIGFIAALLGVVAAILLAAAPALEEGSVRTGILAAAGTVGLVSAIVMIVVFVLQLVGLWQGGKDEDQIRYAFFLTIFAVVLGLTAAILGAIPNNSVVATIANYVRIAVDIATVLALEYTLLGIAALANKLGDSKMERLGRMLAIIVMVLFVLSILLNLYPNFINTAKAPDWVNTMIAVTGIVAGVVELAVYIITIVYYGKATKMLKK